MGSRMRSADRACAGRWTAQPAASKVGMRMLAMLTSKIVLPSLPQAHYAVLAGWNSTESDTTQSGHARARAEPNLSGSRCALRGRPRRAEHSAVWRIPRCSIARARRTTFRERRRDLRPTRGYSRRVQRRLEPVAVGADDFRQPEDVPATAARTAANEVPVAAGSPIRATGHRWAKRADAESYSELCWSQLQRYLRRHTVRRRLAARSQRRCRTQPLH